VTKSKWGGLVWKLKNRCRQKLSSTLEKCTTIQKTPSRGMVWRDFSKFEGMKKFYHRHSVKKCTKYPFDNRAHLKTVRRLWFSTFDRLETWLILSGTIRSKQYHESTMVLRNLPSYHLWLCLLLLETSREMIKIDIAYKQQLCKIILHSIVNENKKFETILSVF